MVCLCEVDCDKCRNTFVGNLHARHHICPECQAKIDKEEEEDYLRRKNKFASQFSNGGVLSTTRLAEEIFDLNEQIKELKHHDHHTQWDM